MRISRIYQALSFAPHREIELDTRASHYLSQVLRARINDSIVLFNHEEKQCEATIIAINKKTVTVKIGVEQIVATESPLKIHLFQGISRGEKMDFVLQKSVELGVSEITPVFMEHCNLKLNEERSDKRMKHWEGVIISACEQSGRIKIPTLNPIISFTEINFAKLSGLTIVLDPDGEKEFSTLQKTLQEINLLIGPEGGISTNEIEKMKKSTINCVRLGPRILRTETAGLVAIAIAQHRWGDLK